MKQRFHPCAVLLFFLLVVSSESIRLLSTKRGEEMKLNNITKGGVHEETVEADSAINQLMGLEACENGDEDCLQRRMASEAHLDYIYTQQHRP